MRPPRTVLALLCALLAAVTLVVLPDPGPVSGGAVVWHVVRPGETMKSIAGKHGVRVADVGRWNQIVPPYPVHVDETLRLTRPATPLPAWRSRIETVTAATVNWNPAKKCPVAPADLRRVWVSYIDFQGAYHDGSIIVHKSIATATQRAFQTLFRWRFRIMAMAPMATNMPGWTDMSSVTSGYQGRPVAGTTSWSEHAYGRAIDINPLQNPMLRGTYLDPPNSRPWLNRSRYLIGMVHPEGAAQAFTREGFQWGGRWRSLKDYMHFSPTNR